RQVLSDQRDSGVERLDHGARDPGGPGLEKDRPLLRDARPIAVDDVELEEPALRTAVVHWCSEAAVLLVARRSIAGPARKGYALEHVSPHIEPRQILDPTIVDDPGRLNQRLPPALLAGLGLRHVGQHTPRAHRYAIGVRSAEQVEVREARLDRVLAGNRRLCRAEHAADSFLRLLRRCRGRYVVGQQLDRAHDARSASAPTRSRYFRISSLLSARN